MLIAVAGATISIVADSIIQLLTIAYVLGSGGIIIALAQWFWRRMNRYGAFAGLIVGWVVVIGMLIFKVFDAPMDSLLNLEDGVKFSTAERLTGARMLFAIASVTSITILVTLLTPPEPMENLKRFLLKARPFAFGWQPVIKELDAPCEPIETFRRTLLSWCIGMVMVLSLLCGVGEMILGSAAVGVGCLLVSALSLWWLLRRFQEDYVNWGSDDMKAFCSLALRSF